MSATQPKEAAVNIAEIYEEMIRKNTSLISNTEYQITTAYTQFDNTIMSPSSIKSTQKGERLIQMANQNILKTPASTRIKPRNVMFGSLNVTGKEGDQRTLLLNSKPIKYIADTGSSMSVISEDTARTVGTKISPYDGSRIIPMTAEGNQRRLRFRRGRSRPRQLEAHQRNDVSLKKPKKPVPDR